MYDLAKMFLHCLNHWKLETPTARKQTMSAEDISAYKVWVYSHRKLRWTLLKILAHRNWNLLNKSPFQSILLLEIIMTPSFKIFLFHIPHPGFPTMTMIFLTGQLHQMALLLPRACLLWLITTLRCITHLWKNTSQIGFSCRKNLHFIVSIRNFLGLS